MYLEFQRTETGIVQTRHWNTSTKNLPDCLFAVECSITLETKGYKKRLFIIYIISLFCSTESEKQIILMLKHPLYTMLIFTN